MNAKQVPLHELLSSIPADARLVIDDPDGKGTRFIPVGRYCQEAAAALAEQCQCGDRPAAECPGAWEPGCDLGANERYAKVHEPQEPDAYRYALGLASSIWSRHYKDTAPGWKPLDDLVGLLSQIDNMVTGLVRQEKAALAEPTGKPSLQVEPVAWRVLRSDGQYELYFVKASAERAAECYISRTQVEPLYTHPAPQRQPLTEDEAWDMWEAVADRGKKGVHIVIDFARAIEDAVWEKINGNKT